MIPSNMDVDDGPGHLDLLFSGDEEKCMDAIVQVKNSVIGNNKQKCSMIDIGIIPRLLQWMIDDATPIDLKTLAADVLASLAKGTSNNVHSVIEAGSISVLLKGLSNANLKYVEACLRCLRTLFVRPYAPVDSLYHDATVIPHLINIVSKSVCTQECITTIFANCCKTSDHQSVLCCNGAVLALAPLLTSNIYKVQIPTLQCLSTLCYKNKQVATAVAAATYNGEPIANLLVKLLYRDKTSEMQMAAAKCLTYLCRGGAIEPHNPIILLKTLSTLIRMCKKDRTLDENIEGAETLAYLIDSDAELQKVAAITDHVIKTLADYLICPNDLIANGIKNSQKKDVDLHEELTQAALGAFAALGANDEDIRKKIIRTEGLMTKLVSGMGSSSVKVQISAVRCLHSLSRSVQQLRTSFLDFSVWKPLMKIIESGPEEVLTIASSVLCNLLLEFSPTKEPVVEAGAVEILVGLTSREEPLLRLNGIWGLMNMAFQAEQELKTSIAHALGTEKLFLLLSDPNPHILMKTLGLLRNLLSDKQHIDTLMGIYGNQIMQAVVLTLEGDHSAEIKEQTLCILINVADGESAKSYIMGNEDVLKKLFSYMICSNVNLQLAATMCITNLIWDEEEGAYGRQSKLREMGVQKLLQQMLSTTHSTLYEKVTKALQQFTS